MSTMTLTELRDWHSDRAESCELFGKTKTAAKHRDFVALIDAHLAQPAQAVDARAEAYAERLARSLWHRYYAEDAPQWEPLTGDLLGLLSQIDNMTTGLIHAPAGEKAGPVADDRAKLLEIMEGFDTQTNVCPKCWEETDIRDFDMANDLRAYLSASATPDKEG